MTSYLDGGVGWCARVSVADCHTRWFKVVQKVSNATLDREWKTLKKLVSPTYRFTFGQCLFHSVFGILNSLNHEEDSSKYLDF